MSIELFDEDNEPVVKLILEIYDYDEQDFIPNWWLEVNQNIPTTDIHIRGILMSLSSIERQLEKLVDLLDESE